MKPKHMISAVFVLVLVSFTIPSIVWSGEIYRTQGSTARVDFWEPIYEKDNQYCGDRSLSVFVYTTSVKDPPGAPYAGSMAFIYLSEYNYCLNKGFSGYQDAAIDTSAFNAAKGRLDSASLKTTVDFTVYDWFTWETRTGTLLVDLAWTGIAEPYNERSSYHSRQGKCQVRSQTNGTYRSATASGAISGAMSDGSTISFDVSGGWATLGLTRDGFMQLSCGY